MAFKLPSNLEYLGSKPNFSRDTFLTVSQMQEAISQGWIDEGHISYCKENGIRYHVAE